jgi:acyl carrier protein
MTFAKKTFMPTRSEVLSKVQQIIADLTNRDPETVRPSDPLSKFGFDSNGIRVLTNRLNDEFGVEIMPSEVSDCETVNDLVSLIVSKLL